MAMSPRLLRPVASGFDPRRIAGLVGWWDSTDNATIATDTGVTSWSDKSGNGYTLTQGTGANQPTVSSIGGRQAFLFNGSAQFLSSSNAGLSGVGTSTGANVPNLTCFYACQISAAHLGIAVAWGSNTSDAPFHGPIHPTNVGGSVWRTSYRSNDSGTTFVNSTATYATATPLVIATAQNNSAIVGRVSGTEVLSPAPLGAIGPTTTSRFAVGALLRNSAAVFFNGRIGDVVVYNRVLSASEITRVERWLAGKFAVTLT